MSITSNYEHNSVDLSTIEFKESKAPSPITLLLIHGAESSKEAWNPVFAPLKDKYNIVALDIRGHGESPIGNADFSMDQIVTDIERVVSKKKLDKFVIVAHSMGVRIALPYAVKHPEQVKGLILEDLHVIPRSKQELNSQEIENLKNFKPVHPNEEEAKQELTKYGYKDKFKSWLEQGRIKRIENEQLFIGVHPYISYLARNAISATTIAREAIAKLNLEKTPLLLMRADKDPKKFSSVSDEGLKEMQEMQPSMKYVYVSNAEHNIHKTETEVFLKHLNDFVNELK